MTEGGENGQKTHGNSILSTRKTPEESYLLGGVNSARNELRSTGLKDRAANKHVRVLRLGTSLDNPSMRFAKLTFM
jgi:hypothetical protein